MQGLTPYTPVTATQGLVPYQGALPATWAYQNTDMTTMIQSIMPLIILVMMMAMIMPMFKGIAGK